MKPKICGVITAADQSAIAAAAPLVDLFEIRIDLIGEDWAEVTRSLTKPWLACNRLAAEGGHWRGTEVQRKAELLRALDMGASIIDLELATPNLAKMVAAIKKKVRCLISHHDFNGTPSFDELKEIVLRQVAAGADIGKVVTIANSIDDNLNLLRLYDEFPDNKLVAFGMGEAGVLSRVLAPLAGAEFTYASLETGKQSAPGQLTTNQLAQIYGSLKYD